MIRYKKEHWYLELKSHIESVHKDHFKTILITGPHFYQVVSRTNSLSTKLWIEYINQLLFVNKHIKTEPIKRINWLITQKKYRRELQQEIESKINDSNAPQNITT